MIVPWGLQWELKASRHGGVKLVHCFISDHYVRLRGFLFCVIGNMLLQGTSQITLRLWGLELSASEIAIVTVHNCIVNHRLRRGARVFCSPTTVLQCTGIDSGKLQRAKDMLGYPKATLEHLPENRSLVDKAINSGSCCIWVSSFQLVCGLRLGQPD